jgi:hypothetical protein
MKFRARTTGLVVAVAAAGLFVTGMPAAFAATAPTATGPVAAKAAGPVAAASRPVSVGVEIVTPLPHGVDWHGHGFQENGKAATLPAGYKYKDGGVVGPDGNLVYVPDGTHDGVVVTRAVSCKGSNFEFGSVDTHNFLGNIISGAFNVARAGVDAADGIAMTAVGAADTSGVKC